MWEVEILCGSYGFQMSGICNRRKNLLVHMETPPCFTVGIPDKLISWNGEKRGITWFAPRYLFNSSSLVVVNRHVCLRNQNKSIKKCMWNDYLYVRSLHRDLCTCDTLTTFLTNFERFSDFTCCQPDLYCSMTIVWLELFDHWTMWQYFCLWRLGYS